MPQFEPRVDDYIDNAAEFAKPILLQIREIVHQAQPEIEEKIKWGHVHFDYKGPVCYMAAFKQHCNFGFWKTALMPDPARLFKTEDDPDGKLNKIKTTADLPDAATLISYIRNAIMLNEQGVKTPRNPAKASAKGAPPAVQIIPDDFMALLTDAPSAKAYFEKSSNTHRKEYLQWITEAKTEATRQKRMQTAIEWLSEGKSRNWKYQ